MVTPEFPGHRDDVNDGHDAAVAWLAEHLRWERRLAELRRAGTPTMAVPTLSTEALPVRRQPCDLTPTESGSTLRRLLEAEPRTLSALRAHGGEMAVGTN